MSTNLNQAGTKEAATKKLYTLLYGNFVKKDIIGSALESIMHKNGFIYASNGYILAQVEHEYPEEIEGKAFRKDRSLVNNTVPYDSVIPLPRVDDESFTSRINDLRAAAKKVCRVGDKYYEAVIDTGLTGEMGSNDNLLITFQASFLVSAFQLFDLLKEDFMINVSSSSMRCMMIESLSSETKVLIMPIWTPYLKEEQTMPTFTIEEAMNYQPEIESKDKQWYE